MGSPQSKLSRATGCLAGRSRQSGNLPQHRAKQPPRQVALRQHQPVVARVFEQPATGLDQPLLQTGQ